MTTLYRPVLIESAEQAEALPAGSLIVDPEERGYRHGYRAVADPADLSEHHYVLNDYFLGWTALVPVEVEVEQIRETGGRRRAKTLYVTPWEGAADVAEVASTESEGGAER